AIKTEWGTVVEPSSWSCPFFLQITVNDSPGVIGQIGTIFGENKISLASIVQKGTQEKHADIVIVTQSSPEGTVLKAIEEMKKCA
ncbi:ACT domain-containing protein, partial [Acinetobacter baumannii]